MRFYLKKSDLASVLRRTMSYFEVIAPVLIEGEPHFVTWKGEEIALDAPNPIISPVKLFLPARDRIFSYLQESGIYTFKEEEVGPRLIVGVRPCDLQALSLIDRIMLSEPVDELYSNRRRSTALIALNCNEPAEGCFCAQMKSGPEAKSGFDLLLTDIGDGFLVEVGSPAGILIVGISEDLFSRYDEMDGINRKRKLMAESYDKIVGSRPWLSPDHLLSRLNDIDWRSLAEGCVSCGGCSFVCPTCHCFNIADLGVPDGERMRCADSCIFSGFHRMASGANPKAKPGERLLSWHLEKLRYLPMRTGMIGCVGCGRCDRVCFSQLHNVNVFK